VRPGDDFILLVLHLRRRWSAARVAREMGITPDRVREICQSVREADLKASTKKNVEKTDDIVLHYPHR
jgi:predicted metalloprotease with PDZ domain